MKKIILLLLFLLSSAAVFAQVPAKKWVIVQDLEDRIVYLDTTAIKQYDTQLAVWGLTVYRQPQKLTPFQALVTQVKSNFVFNTVTNTYSVIGTLYYDRSGRIIGESAAPRITGGEDTFELPVQPGSSVEILYKKASNYLTFGTLSSEPSEFLKDMDFSKQNVPSKKSNAEKTDTVKQTEPVKLSPEENIKIVDESNKNFLEDESAGTDSALTDSTTKKIELAKIDESSVRRLNTPQNRSDLSRVKVEQPKKEKKTISEYDNSEDTNISSNIWSDGNLYVIQLSSWKRKSVAEEQVRKRKAEGHKAYIMQVELPGRGTWYRVRVGYFNSLEEARQYKRENNF